MPQIDPAQALEFVEHYFKYADPLTLRERKPEDLVRLLLAHAQFGWKRREGETLVEVQPPSAPGESTVVLVITDDRRFIVDSVATYLAGAGWAIREVFHPQFQVVRDEAGELVTMVHRSQRRSDARAESWMLVEAFPPLGESADDLIGDLADGLRTLLRSGDLAVADYPAMLAKLWEAIALLRQAGVGHEAGSPVQLLRWLADDHFTFIGFADYRLVDDELVPAPGSGLGMLRGVETVSRWTPTNADEPFTLAKDPLRSPVHRRAHLDRISVRRFDHSGRVIGEFRFLGLLTSAAYNASVDSIPYLRAKAEQILQRSGLDPESHGAKEIETTLDAYPRDELLQASTDELYPVVMQVSELMERRVVRSFIRIGGGARFVYALVYFPRDRYTTGVRERMQQVLMDAYDGLAIEHQARVGDSSLARLYFMVLVAEGSDPTRVDVETVHRDLERATRTWDDEFEALVGQLASEQRGIEFSEAYREDFTAEEGVADLLVFNTLTPTRPLTLRMVPWHGDADLLLRIYLAGGELTLTQALPLLASTGVEVLDERPYEIELRGTHPRLYEFGLRSSLDEQRWDQPARQRFIDAVQAGMEGRSITDSLNQLVVAAGLTWQQVVILRAISRYLQQAGLSYSQTYIAEVLLAQTDIAKAIVDVFEAKFRPDRTGDRGAKVDALVKTLDASLDALALLDHDRILRSFAAVVAACVRTNAYTPTGPFAPGSTSALALKLHPRELDFLPAPRPAVETFVHAVQVEGTHLRFADVARGGLRWSDRREDFRTEVLGLVKAQMVKNTVIVPSGAKGGFVPQHLPDPRIDRGAWLAAGKAAYQTFIRALLSITDNIVDGEVVTPPGIVRHDTDDPYLVVAADKGTASFSDVANAIALEESFWLGDAFASGGSNGYDHKAMGITARGAWESTKHHFATFGIDCQSQDFTCVGIGDMSGDVFGNGMLASEHTRLVAAFDHRHIFVDPDPDAASSYAERKRLFELPSSSWADYDPALISAGGGVFARTAKSIAITAEMAAALGLADTVTSLTPDELISAVLCAPVDLLWNGGIGTYVKASSETHAAVGDKANDHVRVDGRQVRARCAVEGGNLGWTQAGRVEYSHHGGVINTDFIDNSAGVDTSDHEVNIKIMLDAALRADSLDADERNPLLQELTDEVAELVLSHNVDQNVALANARATAAGYTGIHDRWMHALEASGHLDRQVEDLPDSAALQARIEVGEGLVGPELATLMAWTKIWLAEQLLASDLPEDAFLEPRLVGYFPKPLQKRFADEIAGHRLRREIITTVAVNRYVNSQGISSIYRMAEHTGASPANIVRAQLAARTIFAAGSFESAIRRAGLDAAAQTRLRLQLRTLVEHAAEWLLRHHPDGLDIQQAIADYGEAVKPVINGLRDSATPDGKAEIDERIDAFNLADLDDELRNVVAGAHVASRALPIVQIARELDRDTEQVTRLYFDVAERLRLGTLLAVIEQLSEFDQWDELARGALRADLIALIDDLVRAVLRSEPDAASAQDWLEQRDRSGQVRTLVAEVAAARPDLAKASVAVRAVRTLL